MSMVYYVPFVKLQHGRFGRQMKKNGGHHWKPISTGATSAWDWQSSYLKNTECTSKCFVNKKSNKCIPAHLAFSMILGLYCLISWSPVSSCIQPYRYPSMASKDTRFLGSLACSVSQGSQQEVEIFIWKIQIKT